MSDATVSELAPLPPMGRLVELMMEAARLGRDDMVVALASTGVDLESRDPKGYTPTILASYNGQTSTTKLLLEMGANPDAADSERGNTALMGVAFKGHADIARSLLEAGASVDRTNAAGQTALMMAALFGQVAIVEMLLEHGADRAAVDTVGNSAASLAEAQGNIKLAEALKTRQERSEFGQTDNSEAVEDIRRFSPYNWCGTPREA